MRGRVQLYRDDAAYLNGREATNPGDPMVLDTRVTRPGTYYVRIDDINRTITEETYQLLVSVTQVVDVHEPNNAIGDAAILKDRNRTRAMIFDQGDVDWYRVSVAAGETLQVTVADTPAEIRAQINIFDHSGTWLTGKAATNAGQELTVSRTMDTPMDCYFQISHAGNNAFSTAPYTLIVNGARFTTYSPLAHIDAVSPNPADAGQPVTLEGHGTDMDGEITGYAWRSSLDGPISVSRVATIEQLSPGTHTLYLKVMDNDQNWSPETSTVLYYGVPAPREQEPNDEIGQATPMDLDKGYTGKMDKAGDLDFYRITVPQAGRLSITVTNPTGSAMRNFVNMFTRDADNAYISASANEDGDPVTLTWDLAEAGDYFARIHDYHNRMDGQYTATAQFQPAPDPYEPNPDTAHATHLAIGEVIQANIFPSQDVDWYQLQSPHPGTLTLSLTHMPNNLRGTISIFNANAGDTYVSSMANNEGDNVFLAYQAPTPGLVYVRIYDRDNDQNPGEPYTLTTGFTPAIDTHEPNDSIGQATPVTASPLQAYIFPAGDQDWYRIRAQAGATLTMRVDDVPANLRPQMHLYGPNLNNLYVSAFTETEGESVTLTYTVPENGAGYYYLYVADRDNDFTALQPYGLTIEGAEFTPLPPDTPVTVESGQNREFRLADPIDTKGVTGTFTAGEHWFRFNTDTPSLLTLSLQVPASIRSVMVLYNADKQEQARRTAQNPGDVSGFSFAIPEPGTWYVMIQGVDDGVTSLETFTLDLTLEQAVDVFEPNNEFAGAKPLIPGKPVQAMIFPRGDEDWFFVEADTPGMIQFVCEDVPLNINMNLQVYDRNNSFKTQIDSLNAGDPLTMNFYAADAGTYYIRLHDSGSNAESTAPYSLTAFLTPMEDLFEPNDRFSQSTALTDKNQVTGMIYPARDADWYTFTVSNPGTLTIQMAEAEGIQPNIGLFSSSKTHLKGTAALNRGDDIVLTHEITQPDRYYVLIQDDGNNNFSERPYVLTILGGDFENSHPMAFSPTLGPNPAIEGQAVSFQGDGVGDGSLVSGYQWVSDLDGPLVDNAAFSTQDLSGGMHTIRFRVRNNQGLWSAWVKKRLHVTQSILDEAEYNNDHTRANPMPLQTWISGRIHPAGDVDFYKIHISTRGYLTVLLDGVPAGMRGAVNLYDAAGGDMYQNAMAANKGEWVSRELFVEPGWYHIRVHDRDNLGHDSSYGVFFDFIPTLDRYEPNDRLSRATPLETQTDISDAYISRPQDTDWYQISIPSPGRLAISLTDMPSGMRGAISIYNVNGDNTYESAQANNDGEDVFRDYDVTVPGTFFIGIHDRDNQAHTDPYTLTTRFTPVMDGYEPNNTIGSAALMDQSPVSAHIFPRGDEDWYKVFAEAGATLTLSVTQVPEAMRASIGVYDTNMSFTYQSATANNGGDSLYMTYQVPVTGIYTIQVRDVYGLAHTLSYTFAVDGGTLNHVPEFDPVLQEKEPNDDAGQANDIPIGTDITGTIDPQGDWDWYRFHVNAPGIITVSHTNIPTDIRSQMWIHDAGKSQIDYRVTTNNGEDNILTLTVNQAGFYFVSLKNLNNTVSSETYALRIEHFPVVDPNEPNDTYGTATPLGQGTIQGYLFPDGDQDWYRVFVREPGTLRLSLDVVPEDLRPRLTLYNADKSHQGSWVSTNAGVGGEDLISVNVPEPGYYYVQVNNEGTGYSAAPYTLRISGADFTLAPVLSPIGDRTIDAAIAYGFSVHASDPDNPADLIFSATGLPPGASFDPATRTFSWTSTKGQAGTYPGITFKVSDGTHSVTESIAITVTPWTSPPVLAPIGDKTIPVEIPLAFTIAASDPDGQALTFNATGLPAGAAFDPDTQTFSWTPATNQIRRHENIRFEATNGVWTAFEIISITVTPALPAVKTGEVNEITRTSATVSGETLSTGGAAITERGIVYGRTPGFTQPEGSLSHDTGGLGKYTLALMDIAPNTTYYIKAYAINEKGTGYGEEVSFRTARTMAGDINGDGRVDMADLVLCLQIISEAVPADGIEPVDIRIDSDVNGDERIGMEEALYIIHHMNQATKE
jgi:hypothetical protein